eukprot:g5587.t1
MIQLGHYLYAYMYMRNLADRNPDLCYATILAEPSMLLQIMYTPTVGEACQKFGLMPLYSRGCYVSISDRGNIRAVLEEYAATELEVDPGTGKPACDCIVFSDGGRILGLGDLGAWGMGIPLGKLDLYTVCGGLNPRRTVPCILDAGCFDSSRNTARLVIRDHDQYTGERRDRVTHLSEGGTVVNSAYYGADSMVGEFMQAATDLFGTHCLLQFEDFNSNDAFPLLAEYRDKYLTYNDDIQGTAAVTVAGILGGLKLKNPGEKDLIGALRREYYLFHGAGSANLGALKLLHAEGGVPKSRLAVTNSRGLIWKSADGADGSFRNAEQAEFARVGEVRDYNPKDLVAVVEDVQPSCLIGAVGVAPGCFTKPVIAALMKVNGCQGAVGQEGGPDSKQKVYAKHGTHSNERPIVFALSNPKTQAEITAKDAYEWSEGHAIYGSGTQFDPVTIGAQRFDPGQVNNVYIFPGLSMGAVACQASSIPERFFMVAAEAVANSLSQADLEADRVMPHRSRLREVAQNVATATAVEAQKLGLAGRVLGKDWDEVHAAIGEMMWLPEGMKKEEEAEEEGGGGGGGQEAKA